MTPIEIVMPEPDSCGNCDTRCALLGQIGSQYGCRLSLAVYDVDQMFPDCCVPGPRCVPGRYVLVPVERWAAATDALRRIVAVAISMDMETDTVQLARKALGEEKNDATADE